MTRILCYVLAVLFFACKNNKGVSPVEVENFEYEKFAADFEMVSLPFNLFDTTLAKKGGVDTLSNIAVSKFLTDSLRKTLLLFEKNIKIHYQSCGKIEKLKAETYFIIKAFNNRNKFAAVLLVFDKEKKFTTAMPFLIPDADATTSQFSVIDKSFTISRNIYRKLPEDLIADGKEVFVFDATAGKFNLIVTDLLDEANTEFINPIDTFSRKHKLAGDYGTNNNIVSVRDGRNTNELTFYVHFEKNKGECKGELKGVALLTTPTNAVYRQGGDPCVLQLKFANNSVTLREEEGCGTHRGVQCIFEGTFQRKKKTTPAVKKK